MKRLILIQNDYSGAGKSTLGQCLHHYLQSFRAPHHRFAIVETADPSLAIAQIDAGSLRRTDFIAELDRSDLTILEVDSDLAEFFATFYKKHDLEHLLPELGIELTVAVPVTSDRESFDGVTAAAETFSDSAQYLIVHTPTSSVYDDDDICWERSYAARVMDMFEAADLHMPPCSETLELRLKLTNTTLPQAMNDKSPDPALQEEFSKWFRRVAVHIDTGSKYIFGDAFRPAIIVKHEAPASQRRARKTKVIQEAAA